MNPLFVCLIWISAVASVPAQGVVGGAGIPGVTRRVITQPLPTGYTLPGAAAAGNPLLQRGAAVPPAVPAVSPQPRVAPALVYAPRPMDPLQAQAARDEAEIKAVAFQKKRAAEGAAWAQHDLAVRYFTGNGVEQDIEQGRHWLEKAAAQDDTRAKRKLEELKRVIAQAERALAARQRSMPERVAASPVDGDAR